MHLSPPPPHCLDLGLQRGGGDGTEKETLVLPSLGPAGSDSCKSASCGEEQAAVPFPNASRTLVSGVSPGLVSQVKSERAIDYKRLPGGATVKRYKLLDGGATRCFPKIHET